MIEAGYTGEYWREVACSAPELSKRDCGRVLDILDMFRIITFSIRRLEKDRPPSTKDLKHKLFRGFDGNDGLENHMAHYVRVPRGDGRWAELHEQWKRNDEGTPTPMLDTYMRMVAEHRAALRLSAGHPAVSSMTTCCPRERLQQIADVWLTRRVVASLGVRLPQCKRPQDDTRARPAAGWLKFPPH